MIEPFLLTLFISLFLESWNRPSWLQEAMTIKLFFESSLSCCEIKIVWALDLLGEIVFEVGVLIDMIRSRVLNDSHRAHLNLIFWRVTWLELGHLVFTWSCYVARPLHSELVIHIVATLVPRVAVILVFAFPPFVDYLSRRAVYLHIPKIKYTPSTVLFSLSENFNLYILIGVLNNRCLLPWLQSRKIGWTHLRWWIIL